MAPEVKPALLARGGSLEPGIALHRRLRMKARASAMHTAWQRESPSTDDMKA